MQQCAQHWDATMSRTIQRNYDLNEVSLAVLAAEEANAGFLDSILSPLAVNSLVAPDWTVRLRVAETIEPPPAHARHICDGPLPEGLPSLFVEERDRQILFVPNHFVMSSIRSARSTDIDVTPVGAKSIAGTAAFWLLTGILAACNRHLLHGACLVNSPRQEAFALFAASGRGKTTTALALAREGLSLAGDDALVLSHSEQGFYLWGIPRKIKVHRRSVELLPWLHSVVGDWTAGEQAIGREALASVIQIADSSQRPVAGAIILLRPNAVGHRVEAIAKVDALTEILTDNVRRAPTGVGADAQAAYAAIARFIAATPTIALSVGPDPSSLRAAEILSAFRTGTK
jgi:hypothetical protein